MLGTVEDDWQTFRFDSTATDFRLRAQPDASESHGTLIEGMVAPLNRPFIRYGQKYAFSALWVSEPLHTVKLLIEHDPDRVVGHAVSARIGDDGLHMTFLLPDLEASDKALESLAHNLRDGFSVGVELQSETVNADGSLITLTGLVRESSLCAVPTFNESRATIKTSAVLATHAATAPRKEKNTMSTPTLPTVENAAERFSIAEAPEFAELAGRVATLEAGGGTSHPLARFASLAAAIAYGTGADAERIRFALADNTSEAGANAGVMPPGWLKRVYGILEQRRTVINAFGGPVGLPESGMSVGWPYFDGLLTDYVGEQTAQKTEITSAAVDIKAANAPVKTYAGGADNALQLIERSDPSFLEAWGRIMLAAYAVVTDSAFTVAVDAVASAGTITALPPANVADLKAFLFDASDAVDDATGAPASFALASPAVFSAIGKLDGIEAGEYGTVNTAGTASAATLRINVSGLPVLKARGLAESGLIVSNAEAASFGEDGPSFINALNVSRLGRDTAIYGYGASMVHIPAGIIKATVAPAGRSGSK